MDWDTKDSALLATALAGVYADTQATKEQIKKGGSETNPLLPRKPSGQELDRAGVIAALLGTGAAAALPKEWRKPALGAWAGLEHGLAYKNSRANPKAKETDFAHSSLEGPLMMAALGGLLGHMMGDSKVSIDLKKGEKSPVEMLLTYKQDF